jgi:hypothetical protein
MKEYKKISTIMKKGSAHLNGQGGAMRCQEVDNGGKDSAKTETLG